MQKFLGSHGRRLNVGFKLAWLTSVATLKGLIQFLFKSDSVNGDHLPFNKLLFIASAFLLAAFICAVAFGWVVNLPLFFDDLVQLPFVERYSTVEHWTGAFESPYYRPLTITLWKLIYALSEPTSPIVLHATNLLFHIINCGLVGWLTIDLLARLAEPEKGWWHAARGLTAVILYSLLPFHYQAVPWVTALFHIFISTLVLSALIVHLNGRRGLTLGLIFLAPFAHENGIVISPLILLIELLSLKSVRENLTQTLISTSVYALPLIGWGVVRTFVTTAREGDSMFPGWESVFQSTTYFLQGLGWPGAILSAGLVGWSGLNDISVVWLSSLFVLGLGILIVYRSGFSRPLIFAFVLWLGGSLPVIAVLPFGYNISSPRLFTLAGVGISLFWALVVVGAAEKLLAPNKSAGRLVIPTLFLIIFGFAQWQSILHLQEKASYHKLLGNAVQQAAEIAQSLDNDEAYPVFINFPSTLAPWDAQFPLGNEVVIFWPGYTPPNTLLSANRPVSNPDQEFLRVDHIRVTQPYRNSLIVPTAAVEEVWPDPNAVYFNTFYSADSIQVVPAGRLLTRIEREQAGKLNEADDPFQIELQDISVSRSAGAADKQYQLDFEWQVQGTPADSITFFVHGINPAGEIVAQSDGDLVAGIMPISQLADGANFLDIRHLAQSEELTSIRFGIYDRISGERFYLHDADGNRYPEDMIIMPIQPLLADE